MSVWLLLGALLAARAEVIDRVVAVVDGQPILDSEVRLEEWMTGLDPASVPFLRDVPRDPLQHAIDAALIRRAASDVALYEPPRDAVRERLERIRLRFDDREEWSAFLAEWGLDEARLEAVVRRRMVVERYLARNLVADPADGGAWRAECEALLAQLRPRVRVRLIPAGEPSAE